MQRFTCLSCKEFLAAHSGVRAFMAVRCHACGWTNYVDTATGLKGVHLDPSPELDGMILHTLAMDKERDLANPNPLPPTTLHPEQVLHTSGTS